MKVNLSDKIIAYFALLSGLTISAVAIWYSVAGLVSIFAAAVTPIIVMGVALEVSKLIATVWLKLNWSRAPVFIRTYLLIAIAILMVITSMGIFGFLSKAHSDQSLVSGDVQAKIAVYDEKIKTAKDNIDANRKALKQMDEAVDQVMGRSSDEKGADKAVAIRRAQQKERARLQSEIAVEQKTITTISEERAPIAAEVRKVEAEVGPIKYIAAFIYGDNPDANVLEKAVTWVIIIIVSVFDPLAVILLLASQYSFQWFRKAREEEEELALLHTTVPAHIQEVVVTPDPVIPTAAANDDIKYTILEEVEEPIDCYKCGTTLINAPGIGLFCPNKACDVADGWALEEVDEEPSQVQFDLDFNKPVEPEEEPIVIEHIALDPIDEEIIEDSNADDTVDIIEAKRLWKEANPEDSLKHQRRLLESGVINQLPWEVEPYLKKKTLTYLEKMGKQQIKKEISED
jgi:hypothetical protein